jgi:archaellum biogenesis ATPase FlaH
MINHEETNIEDEISKMTIEEIWGSDKDSKPEDNVSGLLQFMMDNTIAKKEAPEPPGDVLRPVEVIPVDDRAELRKAAKFYIDAEISVIPVGMDKIPLIPWKVYQERRATTEEIEAWLNAFPQMQLGIVTGAISKLIVVDVEKGGDPSWLPETAIVNTGGGGWHYYYSYVPGVNNKARIKPLVDIRGDGGYVVAPPSKSNKGQYTWQKQINPVVFPKDLFDITKTERPTIATNNPNSPVLDDEYQGYGEGQRNDEMTRYIGKVLKWVHPSDWDTVAWLSISMANQKNKPPLSELELRKTFESIKSAEKRSQIVERHQHTTAPGSDLWKDEEDEVLPFEEVAARQGIDTDDKIPFNIKLFDDATKGGMNTGDLIIVSAPTGQGKTSFAQSLTFNLSKQAFPCLWFSYEVLPKYLWEKFQEMGVDANDFLAYMPLKHVTGNVQWIENKILEAKKKFWVKVVVIDHLGFLVPRTVENKMENYSAYLGKICRDLKSIAIKQEIIIILPVHMRKTDNPEINDIAHSAGIAQEADLVFTMTREKDRREESDQEYTPYTRITMSKNRKTGMSVKGWFSLENNKFVHDTLYHGLEIPKTERRKKYAKIYGRDDD